VQIDRIRGLASSFLSFAKLANLRLSLSLWHGMRAVHALALTSIAPAAVSSIMIVPSEVKVTVVGGGNAAQVLAALLPHKGFVTSLYCPYKDEAKNIRDGISEQGHMLVSSS
jgi:hypothetical protein